MAAIGTKAMGQHGLIALAAVLHLNRLYVLMAPPFALAGMGNPSLGNCHKLLAEKVDECQGLLS
jgi:hypothetical protein